jgi:predicted histidine transporter YuiF (NhaC family)
LTKTLALIGLIINLIASILIGYGRIFRSKKTIQKESQTHSYENVSEEKHRLIETRIAQLGAVLLAIGFAMQIWGNVAEG